MNPVKLAITAGACALVGACMSSPKLGEGSSAVNVASALPAPDNTGMSTDLSNYRLGPLDDIKIEVFGAPELTREGEVDAAGNFAMPLVGSVAAGGKTPAELASAITEQLKGRYLKNPQVSVNIVKAQGQSFTVDGSVKQPGVYPIIGKMTLQEAVATAKGVDDSANLGNIVVFRTVNGQKMAALFNLQAIRAGQIEDPTIYGNDIVVVGESATRRFFNDVTRAFPVLGVFRTVL
jgi:polysaccharide export outer membrane protein